MREESGLSIAESAALLGTDRTNISNMEGARFGVSAERVRELAGHYGCRDRAYVDGLAGMAEQRGGGWWEEYRALLPGHILDFAELEYHADELTVIDHFHIPGLLQTEEHARVVLRLTQPLHTDVELLRQINHRVRRRAIFERVRPTRCHFYLHEAVLLTRLAGPAVQRRQLDRLLEETEAEHLTLRIIPFSARGYPGGGGAFTYAAGPVPRLDTVVLDSPHETTILHTALHLTRYRTTVEHIQAVALTPEKSRQALREARGRL